VSSIAAHHCYFPIKTSVALITTVTLSPAARLSNSAALAVSGYCCTAVCGYMYLSVRTTTGDAMQRFSSATDAGARTAASVDVSKLIFASAAVEAVTGIILILVPSIFGRLLFGTGFPDIARGVARLTGIALLALAIACWPQQRNTLTNASAIRALLTYNLLAALFFCYWRLAYHSAGPLLWLAVAVHGAFAVLFVRAALRENTSSVKEDTMA
jgi:hypothetical protein